MKRILGWRGLRPPAPVPMPFQRAHWRDIIVTTIHSRRKQLSYKYGLDWQPSNIWIEAALDATEATHDNPENSSDPRNAAITSLEQSFIGAENCKGFRVPPDDHIWEQHICEAA